MASSTAPNRVPPPLCAGHRAVEHVGQHEEPDRERAPPQLADREQRQRGEHRARRAEDGDAVGVKPARSATLATGLDSFA